MAKILHKHSLILEKGLKIPSFGSIFSVKSDRNHINFIFLIVMQGAKPNIGS